MSTTISKNSARIMVGVRLLPEMKEWVSLERRRRIMEGDDKASVQDVIEDAIRFYRQSHPHAMQGELDGVEETQEV